MKKLGRPRKSVRKENISVNLPSYLIKQISDKLSWSSSRSVWIQSAIEDKLGHGNSTYLQDASTLQLLSVLSLRDIPEFVKEVIANIPEIVRTSTFVVMHVSRSPWEHNLDVSALSRP